MLACGTSQADVAAWLGNTPQEFEGELAGLLALLAPADARPDPRTGPRVPLDNQRPAQACPGSNTTAWA